MNQSTLLLKKGLVFIHVLVFFILTSSALFALGMAANANMRGYERQVSHLYSYHVSMVGLTMAKEAVLMEPNNKFSIYMYFQEKRNDDQFSTQPIKDEFIGETLQDSISMQDLLEQKVTIDPSAIESNYIIDADATITIGISSDKPDYLLIRSIGDFRKAVHKTEKNKIVIGYKQKTVSKIFINLANPEEIIYDLNKPALTP